MTVVIIGIGQSLRGDDAAGVLAVETWQQANPQISQHPAVKVEISPLPGLHLLELLEGNEQAIIVDAVQSGATPGTIHDVRVNDLVSFAFGASSVHGWGVAESLALADRLGLEFAGDAGRLVRALAPLEEAGPDELAFIVNRKYRVPNTTSVWDVVDFLVAKESAAASDS